MAGRMSRTYRAMAFNNIRAEIKPAARSSNISFEACCHFDYVDGLRGIAIVITARAFFTSRRMLFQNSLLLKYRFLHSRSSA